MRVKAGLRPGACGQPWLRGVPRPQFASVVCRRMVHVVTARWEQVFLASGSMKPQKDPVAQKLPGRPLYPHSVPSYMCLDGPPLPPSPPGVTLEGSRCQGPEPCLVQRTPAPQWAPCSARAVRAAARGWELRPRPCHALVGDVGHVSWAFGSQGSDGAKG